MNFHTEEWIQRQIERHYNEALKLYNKNQIVGIFLQGSQNYGMDYYNSDVDTKLIIVPTLEDIALNKKPISTTHVLPNNEHIDIKDIRVMFQTFKKQNLNFVEILFTKYCIINPLYLQLWSNFVTNNNLIVNANPVATLKTMKGIALEKYHALEHPYPSKIDIINQYGYDPKQLHHLYRVYEFMKKFFINKLDYVKCLEGSDFTHSLKYTVLEHSIAKGLADNIKQELEYLYEKIYNKIDDHIDEVAYKLIDTYQYKFIKYSIELELKEGEK